MWFLVNHLFKRVFWVLKKNCLMEMVLMSTLTIKNNSSGPHRAYNTGSYVTAWWVLTCETGSGTCLDQLTWFHNESCGREDWSLQASRVCHCRSSRMSPTLHVQCGHSKVDKTKILKTNGSLMKVGSIAEYFWSALIDNRSWKPFF